MLFICVNDEKFHGKGVKVWQIISKGYEFGGKKKYFCVILY